MKLPPSADSAQSFANQQWKIIQTNKSRHFLPAPFIRNVETFFERRQAQLVSKVLDTQFNWEADLFLATQSHRHNLDWLERLNTEHAAYIDHWKSLCTNSVAAGEKLGLAGLNTIYLVHGAVAVGSLNALANKSGSPDLHVAAAAKIAMPSALAGIALAGVGQIILARFGTQMAHTVANKLVGTVTHNKARSFSRYWNKMHRKYLAKADLLIYGSVVWFFVYSVISYIMLVS